MFRVVGTVSVRRSEDEGVHAYRLLHRLLSVRRARIRPDSERLSGCGILLIFLVLLRITEDGEWYHERMGKSTIYI